MISTSPRPLPAAATAAIASGGNFVKTARKAREYSIEDLSVTCGLTIKEITRIEGGDDADPIKLRRIASALQLGETVLIDS
ncbi:transcriptional regulator protein (plasmid) [Rhizobium etli 8C-3]|uniref:Transcriptional regulator protein n=1 Tax=Rhizobium etli 8C-3 TaxID=538025 RepID=A0A1L5PAJ7_RHIET|nr:helix-turn-helix domain-containing protein [Rhizobium etli]APO77113.1 transcriptional regulator protein [Rhizobium etli 8C-3]